MEIQLPPHIEKSIMAAFNAGDYERVASQLAAAARTANLKITSSTLESMPTDHDIDTLATSAVFDASQAPAAGLWPEAEDIEDFLSFVRTHRNDAPVVGQ